MQWKIIQLEDYIADQVQRLKEEKEDKEMWAQQALKRGDEGVDLRGQFYELQLHEKYTATMRKLKRVSCTEDEKTREMKRLEEDAERAKQAASLGLGERQVEDVNKETNEWVLEQMGRARFALERKEWAVRRQASATTQKNVGTSGDDQQGSCDPA